MLKRIFDIILASVALLVFAPIMGVCAAAILITSGRPVLFRQRRIGKGCTEFDMLKFRTMYTSKNHSGIPDLGSDKRVTAVGKILRKTKLDELPQLWNVFVGHMAVVGPRPELRYRMRFFTDMDIWHRAYSVRPGITGPASIIYRNEEQLLSQQDDPQHYYNTVLLPEKLHTYIQYANRQNIWYDMGIIYKTVRAVLGKSYTKDDVL